MQLVCAHHCLFVVCTAPVLPVVFVRLWILLVHVQHPRGLFCKSLTLIERMCTAVEDIEQKEGEMGEVETS